MATVQSAKQATSIGHFRVSRVIARSIGAYLRNVLWMSPAVLAFILMWEAAASVVEPYATRLDDDEWARGSSGFIFLAAFVTMYMFCASLIMQGTILHLRDQGAKFGVVFAHAISRAPLVILLGLLVVVIELVIFVIMFLACGTLATMAISYPVEYFPQLFASNPMELWPLGVAILVAFLPGYYLLMMWNVGSAACIAERLGLFGALERSRRLTKGFRLRIAALVLLWFALFLLPIAVIVAVGPTVTASWSGRVLAYAVYVVPYALLMVIPAATFVELRQAKEGKEIQVLAGVFD